MHFATVKKASEQQDADWEEFEMFAAGLEEEDKEVCINLSIYLDVYNNIHNNNGIATIIMWCMICTFTYLYIERRNDAIYVYRETK